MGIFNKLSEGIFRVRVVPKQTPEDKTNFNKEEDSAANKIKKAIDAGQRINLSDFTKVNTLKCNRNEKYTIFEEMVSDGRIGAALEMYANDSVQYDPSGRVIWVESKDADVAKYCNNLLNDLNIAENIWSYAYCLWLYGDVYLETFVNTSNNGSKPTLLVEPSKQDLSVRLQVPIQGGKLERYIEKVSNPAEIYDLQLKGKTAGFVRSKDNFDGGYSNNTFQYTGIANNVTILSPTKFVHICLSPNINRFPEQFRLTDVQTIKKDKNGYIDDSDSEGASGNYCFTIKSGQSILENVFGAYQTLKLKEDSVLLERLTKSSITRIVQVELGDLPESQKRAKLMEIKNQIEQQIQLNKTDGTMQSRAGAQPAENIIYTTTKNGKGTISTVNIGGDADIGNLDDVTDSENKVYGALLIPKALLGADMDGSGLSNGGSLTEMNTTYARRIKRGQLAICDGIKTLINIFAIGDGVADKVIGNFTVRLTPIITVEDNRRDELLQTKIRNVNDMLNLISDIESIDEDTKLKMLVHWMSRYLNQQEVVDIIDKRIKDIDKQHRIDVQDAVDDATSDSDSDDNDFDIPSKHFSEPDFDIPAPSPILDNIEDTNSDNTEPNTNTNTNTSTPELSNQEDLSNIQGEDLL